MSTLRKVIAGGQTGVDQAALRAARDCGLEIGGWCPPGRVCEDGVIPAEFPLQETPQERSAGAPDVPRSQRTEWNVRDSDGTLVLGRGVREEEASRSEAATEDVGTRWAMECAGHYQKALLLCDADDPKAADEIRHWLSRHSIETLSIGGPSEGTVPGIGQQTYALLVDFFR
jgi:hypothetical protein